MNRTEIADFIVAKLDQHQRELTSQWTKDPIHHFVLDDVLPEELAHRIAKAYPPSNSMRIRRSLRELKFVSAQMNQCDPLLEETLFAFQDPRIVRMVEQISGLRELEPDELLYAGGISMMGAGHFLNPHLDNSHDMERQRYRVLNLLYYVSPGWTAEDGGCLELWPQGPGGKPQVIDNTFNRLVVMITNKTSWHSVAPIRRDRYRCCVSNYFFSKHPADRDEYFHITSFRGRPEQRVRDLVLRADGLLRTAVRKIFPRGAVKTTHYYRGQRTPR